MRCRCLTQSDTAGCSRARSPSHACGLLQPVRNWPTTGLPAFSPYLLCVKAQYRATLIQSSAGNKVDQHATITYCTRFITSEWPKTQSSSRCSQVFLGHSLHQRARGEDQPKDCSNWWDWTCWSIHSSSSAEDHPRCTVDTGQQKPAVFHRDSGSATGAFADNIQDSGCPQCFQRPGECDPNAVLLAGHDPSILSRFSSESRNRHLPTVFTPHYYEQHASCC